MHETRFSIFLRAFLGVRLFAYLQKGMLLTNKFCNNLTPDSHSELHRHILVVHHISGYDTIN
jgi:hypothetical protein